MKILPIQIQIQKELFQCASSWTVEHCSHPCQAGGIRQQIQERVQEAQGQDDCRLAVHQDHDWNWDASDTHTRKLMLFKRF